MPRSLTKYNFKWENDYKFLKPGPSIHEAYCTECKQSFGISNGGVSDIKKHIRCKRHRSIDKIPSHDFDVYKRLSRANVRVVENKAKGEQTENKKRIVRKIDFSEPKTR